MKSVIWIAQDFVLPLGTTREKLVHTLFACENGDVVSRDGKRKVLKLQVDGKSYFLKRDEPRSVIEAVKFIWRNKSFVSRVGRERKIIQMCAEVGIAVMEPVVFAERHVFGFPVEGLLLVKEVVGEEFYKIISSADEDLAAKLMYQYGRIAGVANKNGINSPIRVQDIIVTSTKKCELTLIDREHGKPRSIRMGKRRTERFISRVFKANERFLGGMAEKKLNEFLRGYCEERPEFRGLEEDLIKQYMK